MAVGEQVHLVTCKKCPEPVGAFLVRKRLKLGF